MLMFFTATAVDRQSIIPQHPISISIHPMEHGDQPVTKFMLCDHPVFVAIQLGKLVISAFGKLIKADRTIVICIQFLRVHH